MSDDDKLKILGQTADQVPETIHVEILDLNAAFDQLSSAFNDESFNTDTVKHHIDNMQEKITAFNDESRTELDGLEKSVDAVSTILDEIAELATDKSAALITEMDGVTTHAQQLGTDMDRESASLETALGTMQETRADAIQTFDSRLPLVEEAYDSIRTEFEQTAEKIKGFGTELEKELDEFSDFSVEGESNMDGELRIWEDFVDSSIDDAVRNLTTSIEEAQEKARQAAANFGDRLDSELAVELEKQIAAWNNELEEVASQITQTAVETSDARSLAQPALDKLNDAAERIDQVVDRVKEVARRFSAFLS